MTESGNSRDGALIVVDGATGYLGSHLVSTLVQRGYRVRCLVRREKSMETDESIECIDVDYSKELDPELFSGALALVHLIGSIAPRRGESLSGLHRGITARVVNAAVAAAVPPEKIIQITALGASADAPSEYHRTKWLAEEVVRASGIPYVILRPSLILGRLVGKRDSKLVQRLLTFIRRKPFVPLVRGGSSRIQPIFVQDVVDAIVASIEQSGDSATIELGGGKVLKMKELVDALASRAGKKARILPLDPGLARGIATLAEKLQEVPVLSEDQVVLSLSDNICQANGFKSLVGRDPTELNEAIDSYQDDYIRSL